MSNAVNTNVVNLSQNPNTPADRYFSNYFVTPSTISSDVNDAVIAYFQTLTNGNLHSASILASTVVYTAMAQGLNPMKVLEDFKAVPTGQLNNYIAAFLNINRVPTSSLGIRHGTKTSPFVTRSILV